MTSAIAMVVQDQPIADFSNVIVAWAPCSHVLCGILSETQFGKKLAFAEVIKRCDDLMAIKFEKDPFPADAAGEFQASF